MKGGSWAVAYSVAEVRVRQAGIWQANKEDTVEVVMATETLEVMAVMWEDKEEGEKRPMLHNHSMFYDTYF